MLICTHISEIAWDLLGIALAGNTCFKLTGRGRANRAQQPHKGSKKETRVLSLRHWGSLRGDGGHWMFVFYLSAHGGAVLLTVSVGK